MKSVYQLRYCYRFAYCASKAAVIGMTKSIAADYVTQGIRCNAICPGYVLTPIIEKQLPDQMKTHNMDRETVLREVILVKQPSREFATIDQVAGAALFLCSPSSDQIRGTTISLDGGWTAQ